MRETIFVWASVNDCVMSELDGSGAVQVSYTNEPQQYGGVISQRRGTTTSTYHADALGSTRALTDNSGAVTDTYLNDAWGNSVASTGTTVNPFRWVGKYGYYTDNSTGQVYVRARMYQPTVARWSSVDPLFTKTRSEFAYVDNHPTIWIDRSGLILVAIDGTASRQFRQEDPGYPGTSWVLRFETNYVDGPKRYWDGPDSAFEVIRNRSGIPIGISTELAARQCQAIEDQAYAWVCAEWCKSGEICSDHSPIDMVGHSRGGYIVMQLARRLNHNGCECLDGIWQPVPVRFVGLFDAVDEAEPNYPQDGNANGDRLSPNVKRYAAVIPVPFRDTNGVAGANRSRAGWRRPNLEGSAAVVLGVEATHGGIGGAPGLWNLDTVPNWTIEQDHRGSVQSYDFMAMEARSAGVKIEFP